jgi:hypothetical protein
MKVTPLDCSLRLKLIIEHYSGPPTFHPAQGTRAGSIYKLPSTSTLATPDIEGGPRKSASSAMSLPVTQH